MSNDTAVKKPMPTFRSQAEEDKFFETHDYKDYIGERGAVFIKRARAYGNPKAAKMSDIYYEFESLKDPNLTENINVRFDKQTVAELKELAKHDERTLASLVRRWVLEKMKEYKYREGL